MTFPISLYWKAKKLQILKAKSMTAIPCLHTQVHNQKKIILLIISKQKVNKAKSQHKDTGCHVSSPKKITFHNLLIYFIF